MAKMFEFYGVQFFSGTNEYEKAIPYEDFHNEGVDLDALTYCKSELEVQAEWTLAQLKALNPNLVLPAWAKKEGA